MNYQKHDQFQKSSLQTVSARSDIVHSLPGKLLANTFDSEIDIGTDLRDGVEGRPMQGTSFIQEMNEISQVQKGICTGRTQERQGFSSDASGAKSTVKLSSVEQCIKWGKMCSRYNAYRCTAANKVRNNRWCFEVCVIVCYDGVVLPIAGCK